MKIHVSKVVQVIVDDISDQSDQTLCLKSPKKVSELLHCSIFEVLHPKKNITKIKDFFFFFSSLTAGGLFPCSTDEAARNFFLPPYVAAGIRTHASRVAPRPGTFTRKLLPTKLPLRSRD